MPDPGPTVADRDGGVALRLTRRCRLASSILLAVGAMLLLGAVVRTWDAVGAVLTLAAGALVFAAALLARRAVLWSAVGSSVIGPSAADSSAVGASPLPDAAAETPIGTSGTPLTAVIGPPRPLSPVRVGSPVKRRLGAVVIPLRVIADGSAPDDGRGESERGTATPAVPPSSGPLSGGPLSGGPLSGGSLSGGPLSDDTVGGTVATPGGPVPGETGRGTVATPGGGALVVHARGDAVALSDHDVVVVYPVHRRGVAPVGSVRSDGSSVTENILRARRFVLSRTSDGEVFLATTKLSDTW